ncbi:hypothetical protein Ahy_B03g065169 [Arachis hypogaea]|uniref:Uncharacterized protein n=1 Tax=Arachis hypogaea TaxID=3818 RepID=A0A445A0W6_ARAHY|nr:hypothetical protein Ahy_B03g065169 [Arachis hypogaea]
MYQNIFLYQFGVNYCIIGLHICIFKKWSATKTVNRASNAGSSMHTGDSISMDEHARRMTKLSQVTLSLDNEGDVEASKKGLDIPDDYTIWNEVVTKEKKKGNFGLGSFGLDLSLKLYYRNYSKTSKDNLNIEEELHTWKEKAKEQEMINEEIGSTEKKIHTLYQKLNLPLPSNLSNPAKNELGTGSSDDGDDNMSD